MSKLIVLATFAASVLFAACEHGAPQPGARATAPSRVEPAATPSTTGDPTASEERPAPIAVPPPDAGTPLPGTALPSPRGTANPGPSSMLDTRRNLASDDDLRLLPPAQHMPVTNIPAQPMPSDPGTPGESEPSSVKPDGGILYDGGAPLPPVPDGGPLPGTHDARVPL